MLVDGDGRLFFLERSLNRVQCFSPTADWVYTVALSAADLDIKGTDENEISINYLDMFWCPDSSLGILVAIPGNEPRLFVVKCDADGFVQSSYELKGAPKILDNVENAYCDALGWLWISQDDWFLFDHLGNYSSTVNVLSDCVDSKGFTYSDAKPVRVIDRHGKVAATLKSEDSPAPDLVVYVGDKGDLVSWTRGLPETKSPTALSQANQIVLFKLDREEWQFEAKAAITVPASEYQYPHAESDQAVPTQVYLPKTALVRNGTLYLMAYSAEAIWVNKLGIAAVMK